MRFFFPDSQDQVDPRFDFVAEEHLPHRVRQRDDVYAHEILDERPFDGLLVSKPIVDGVAGGSGHYTMAARHRLYRVGVRRFFRLDDDIVTMGDCGAFAYAAEAEPPYSVEEILDFYEGCGFDRGVAPDHIVFGFVPGGGRAPDRDQIDEWERRRQVTYENAKKFLSLCETRGSAVEPIATAHGWSVETYADSVDQLMTLGYRRIALGGMVPLKTRDILACLDEVSRLNLRGVELHLLGVTRTESITEFARRGVTSFDSTSPFRQAFKDDRDNYYTLDEGNFVALRVPQVDANPSLKRRIKAGRVEQSLAQEVERRCLRLLRSFDQGAAAVDEVVDALCDYEHIFDPKKDHRDAYRSTLSSAPWRRCNCGVCNEVGIEVAIFRGSERNKRRGFHNLAVFRRRMTREVASAMEKRT